MSGDDIEKALGPDEAENRILFFFPAFEHRVLSLAFLLSVDERLFVGNTIEGDDKDTHHAGVGTAAVLGWPEVKPYTFYLPASVFRTTTVIRVLR